MRRILKFKIREFSSKYRQNSICVTEPGRNRMNSKEKKSNTYEKEQEAVR